MQRELEHIVVVEEGADEIDHTVTEDHAERVHDVVLHRAVVAAVIARLELAIVEQRIVGGREDVRVNSRRDPCLAVGDGLDLIRPGAHRARGVSKHLLGTAENACAG